MSLILPSLPFTRTIPVLKVGLPAPAPWQAPQSARRENDGEEPGHSNRDQYPDEKEMSAVIGDSAGDADTLSPHVGEGDDQRKEPSEEGDDVPRSELIENQRSVQTEDKDGHSSEVLEPSRFKPTNNVVRQVKRK